MRPVILHLALLAAATLLASGCCCPMLSGRCNCGAYHNCGCNSGCMPANSEPPSGYACGPAPCGLAPCGLAHGCCLSKLFPGLTGEGVPSEQGPDYSSPQAKFHPVPTRPVFEPLSLYPPTELIEPGGANPLRHSTATIATAKAASIR